MVDENWKDNFDIKLNMIFYLGLFILVGDVIFFGMICILDNKLYSYSEFVIKLFEIIKYSFEV